MIEVFPIVLPSCCFLFCWLMQTMFSLFDGKTYGLLCDLIAAFMPSPATEAGDLQEILEAQDLILRQAKTLLVLKKELELAKMQQEISKQVEAKISEEHKRYMKMQV